MGDIHRSGKRRIGCGPLVLLVGGLLVALALIGDYEDLRTESALHNVALVASLALALLFLYGIWGIARPTGWLVRTRRRAFLLTLVTFIGGGFAGVVTEFSQNPQGNQAVRQRREEQREQGLRRMAGCRGGRWILMPQCVVQGSHFGCSESRDYQAVTEALRQHREWSFWDARAAGVVEGRCDALKDGEDVYVEGTDPLGLVRLTRTDDRRPLWTSVDAVVFK
jgi:hypothetical protein